MLVGAFAKDQATPTRAQLAAAFTRVDTVFGGPGVLKMTRTFEDTLPTSCSYLTPASVLEIPSYKTQDTNVAAYVKSLRAPYYICYHHEPEADYPSGGATFVSEFTAQYDLAHAARPGVMFGMIAGGYQYRANGGLGLSGSFLPPASSCDWYGFDNYRGGDSTGDTGFGAMVPLSQVDEFQNWYAMVKDRGKPLYITEYGRGYSYAAGTTYGPNNDKTWTAAQAKNVLARRPGLFTTDAAYLRSLGFAGMNLWYSDYGPGDDWMFTDQPSIDAWTATIQEGATPVVKDYPHGRSADGHDYICAQCGAPIPDGVQVLAHYTTAGRASGIKVVDTDGNVRHQCGTKLAAGEGEV